jgi:putative ABC transport system permease protein
MNLWRRFRGISGPDPERDVDEELSFHVEMRERELLARGEAPERARELALRRFGELATPRSECVTIGERQVRRMARSEYSAELRQDVLYALRSLRKRPGFTAVVVLTLALGIGANSAIFSVVNGVLLKPLPYANADRLYEVGMVYPDGARYSALSAPDFMSVVELNRAFEAVGSYEAGRAPLLGLGEPREVRAALISDGLFDMLSMPLVRGRGFSSDEHQPGRNDVAVLDHAFWQREFGGSDDALGRTVTYFGQSYTVVGVLAQGAALPWQAELYMPQPYDELFDARAESGRRSEFLAVMGLARPGLGPEQVDADMRRVGVQLAEAFPATNERLAMSAVPLRDTIIGDVRGPLLVLLGAVGFVLLVACANVANLLLARASARHGEFAVRAALGAGRGRLVRQLLTESAVLGVLGGAVGLAIAWVGTRALVAAQPADIPRLDTIGIDVTVVLVTLGVALLTGLLFGAIPAFQATRRELSQSIREGSRGLQGGAGQGVRSALIVAEMALAVILLVGAGLLIRSFLELTRVDAGFDAENAVAFRIAMDQAAYAESQQIRDFVSHFLERVEATPGVVSAAGTGTLPLRGRGALINFDVVGAPVPPDDVNREIGYVRVTPGYFATVGARIVRGRDFGEQDHADAPPVALINEAGARFWFRDEDPIGRRVALFATEREIVGVVSDVLQRDPGSPAMPQLYAPFAQHTARSLQVVVRTAGDPLSVAPSLRTLIRSMDPTMPIAEFTPLRQVAADAVARPRFYTALLTLFAAIALALAGIGIFGVMSYSVTQRAREIGIRMALGASRSSVIGMIVGRSMALAGLGLLAGLIAAFMLGRAIRSQLYNVELMDPATLGAVVLALGGSALAASWLPARRAAGVDPGTVLRE